MNVLGEIVLAAAVGFIVGMLMNARLWWRVATDYYYHGRDNHLCDRVGCCVSA